METLEWEHIELLQQQVGLQAEAVKAEDTDHWKLKTLLGLVAASMSVTAQPMSMAPQVPPTTAQQVTSWA